MKSSTPELLKFKRLQRRLKESQRGLVGLLELLWLGTAKNCPAGDIGKFSNLDIAIMCDYEGDPDSLIEALTCEGWLDKSDEHRLVVHDWHEHCPRHVLSNLKRWGKTFANGVKPSPQNADDDPKDDPMEPPKDDPMEPPIRPSSKPSLTKPNQTKPPPPPPPKGDWAAVAAVLRKFGVGEIQACLDAATNRGETPETCLAVAAEFEAAAGRWTVGGLVYRFKSGNWPDAKGLGFARNRSRDLSATWEADRAKIVRLMQKQGASEDEIEREILKRLGERPRRLVAS